ncbi:TKL protein kinase [Phakopsora pachyrhizi]|uniref:TKL protein kinase n=1 Tax=Phakopsora pachyrhizi TaxID=170000 RepID=A0AAV0AFI3_PHAPC|nr:TKL protein kinase [Phakopsora pachyrhizi]
MPPPPPKKRERTSNETFNTSTRAIDPLIKTVTNNRPTKKEKPAPVTIVYRGAPEDSSIANQTRQRINPNPSMAALPPQTAINRAGCAIAPIGVVPPSTIAPSYSLSHATEASLMKKKHLRLRDLCRERNLLGQGRELTKREMVQALLHWRQYNSNSGTYPGFSENEDMIMSSMSESETDGQNSFSLIDENSIDDSIDPQLFSPELNPGITYNLRPRKAEFEADHQETIRTSQINIARKGIPYQFSNVPDTQLANYFAATGLQKNASPTGLEIKVRGEDSPKMMDEVMSHPPTIPLLDDPVRNSKRRSIRLVGTKVPSIGPIGKMSMSSIVVGGNGPTAILDPTQTMRVTIEPRTAKAGQGTVGMKSVHQPPSPPTSSELESGNTIECDNSGGGNSPEGRNGSAEDLDVLLDLEDLKLADKEIPPQKLSREQKVGSGSFKDVYMGRYRNFRVAICDLRGRLTDMDIKELGLLRDLRHPNIVRFIGVSVGDAVPCTIVTELCRNGDLYDYIRKIPCPSFVQILAMMLDAARGVEYLHLRTPSIIHRDLKSPNVLVTSSGSAKITDFGLARVKRDVMSMCATTCGTLNWQAPELWVAHPSYNHSIDVYALGLVFWEVLCWPFREKTFPFQGMNEHAIFAEVGKNKLRPSTSMIRRKWGRDIVSLIEKMWDNEPDARPGMPDVVRGLNAMLLQEREKAWASSQSST